MRTLAKILSIGLASTLVLALLFVWIITTAPGERVLKGWLESRVSSEIGLLVSILKLETNFWTHLTIDSLSIVSDSDVDREPFVYVGRIHIGYSIPDLLSETIRLKELLVDSVTVAIAVDSLGYLGIPLLDATDSSSEVSSEETTTVQIDSVRVDRVSLGYLDPQLSLSVDAFGASLSAQGNNDGDYTGMLSVSGVLATYDNLVFNLGDLQIGATIDDTTLHLKHARAECEGIHLEASGEMGLTNARAISLSATAMGSMDSVATRYSKALDLPLLGVDEVNATVSVDGTFDDPHVMLNGLVTGLVFASVDVDTAWVRAQYSTEQIVIDSFHLSTLGGTINGSGSAPLSESGNVTVALVFNGASLADLWRAIYAESSPYEGELQGDVSAAGPIGEWSVWKLDAAIAGKNLKYNQKTIPDLLCTARLDSGKSEWSFVHGSDTITSDLVLHEDSLQGTFNVSVPEAGYLSRFFDQTELTGGLWAHGTMFGLFANPSIIADVNGSHVVYRNFPIDTVVAMLSYADSNLTVIDLLCNGTLDSVDIQHPPFDLDSIGGSITYECQLSGNLSDLKGDISARLTKPRYSIYEADSVVVEATIDGSLFELSRLKISRDRIDAHVGATFDTTTNDGAFSIELYPLILSDRGGGATFDSALTRTSFGSVIGEFSLGPNSDVKASIRGQELWMGLLPALTAGSTVSDGELEFNLSIDGPFQTPDAVLSAKVRSLVLYDYSIDSVISHLRLDHNVVILDSLVTHALGQRLRASGELGLGLSDKGMLELPESAPILATLEVQQFNLSVLKEMLLPKGDIAGTISGKLQFGGTTSLPRVDGWLEATSGRFLPDENSSPIEDIAMSLSFADSVIAIDRVTGIVSNIPFEATGSATSSDYKSASLTLVVSVGELGKLEINGLVSESTANLTVSADTLNLAVFEPFVPSLDSLGGRLAGRIEISGPMEAPLIDGTLSIDALAFQSVRQNVTVSNGHASVSFDKNRVVLDTASASINGGNLTISGAIEHDRGELTDIGLSLRAKNIVLEEPEFFTLLVDSAVLSYGKQQDTYVLTGDVVLGEARLVKGFRPTSVLPWVQEIETVDLELPELVARSRLDIRIRESDQLWVDNNLAHIRLRSELGIIGTPVRPNFTGLIKIEEGYLLYLDRRFRVNEGSVYFNDPIRFNPYIKLDASTQITVYRRTASEPYTIYINAEGLLDQLQFKLFSQPPLEQPDIVALLTLGATRTELTSSGENGETTGLTQVLKDRAAMLSSQRVSNYLSRRAGSLFGFDEFTIQGNLFRFDDTWGPQLVASKHLSQNIKLTYSTTVGHLNDQTMRLGYRLTPRWSLQGETDRQGRSGLDLKYGITFK